MFSKKSKDINPFPSLLSTAFLLFFLNPYALSGSRLASSSYKYKFLRCFRHQKTIHLLIFFLLICLCKITLVHLLRIKKFLPCNFLSYRYNIFSIWEGLIQNQSVNELFFHSKLMILPLSDLFMYVALTRVNISIISPNP